MTSLYIFYLPTVSKSLLIVLGTSLENAVCLGYGKCRHVENGFSTWLGQPGGLTTLTTAPTSATNSFSLPQAGSACIPHRLRGRRCGAFPACRFAQIVIRVSGLRQVLLTSARGAALYRSNRPVIKSAPRFQQPERGDL
jgi:hypothetical protein